MTRHIQSWSSGHMPQDLESFNNFKGDRTAKIEVFQPHLRTLKFVCS